MTKLLSILLICSIGFTQELTVAGNLNVTGTIANQTIDSLMQVIADLQSQLSALQGENRLETRFFEIEQTFNAWQTYDFNWTDIIIVTFSINFFFVS